MSKIEELKAIIKYIEESAKRERAEAEKDTCDYTRGINIGTAIGYELCAKWLKEEIL